MRTTIETVYHDIYTQVYKKGHEIYPFEHYLPPLVSERHSIPSRTALHNGRFERNSHSKQALETAKNECRLHGLAREHVRFDRPTA